MSPLVRGRRAESAVSWLAAFESRWIDGASDPRTPIMRRRTHRGRSSPEREQKDDEPRETRFIRVNDSPATGESERTMVGVRGWPHRELPTSWTSVASSIDRSPPPHGPHSRGPHPATLRSERQLVDNSPRGSPRRGERKPTGAFDFGEPLHRSWDKRPTDVKPQYPTLPKHETPRFYGQLFVDLGVGGVPLLDRFDP